MTGVALIIDDAVDVTLLFKSIVQKLGLDAAAFSSPLDALEWSATATPAIVIVDYDMPQMSGFQFAMRFRELPGKNDVPIVMITAHGDADLEEQAREVGVAAVMTKPIRVTTFREKIKALLEA